ncbi:unnamed protein product [Mycena citricolor]|uniref:Uncharacterized protein n=1 Tax=Mycena citricolor TaxID=2018698 RepID=A0AAD2HSC3_9AGAR|nr:unnamed protein product [Mycena citricolor]
MDVAVAHSHLQIRGFCELIDVSRDEYRAVLLRGGSRGDAVQSLQARRGDDPGGDIRVARRRGGPLRLGHVHLDRRRRESGLGLDERRRGVDDIHHADHLARERHGHRARDLLGQLGMREELEVGVEEVVGVRDGERRGHPVAVG